MKRLVFLLALAGALCASGAASAHPLGNFTVNRFSGVQLSGDRIYVHYVLDMAEIPTFQERQKIRSLPAYEREATARIGRGFVLSVGGRRLTLTALDHSLAFPPGQGGLATLRFQALYETPPLTASAPLALAFRDTNYAGRIGWREVVLASDSGTRVVSSTAPSVSRSDELRAYPKELLRSPLDVTQARATFVPGRGSGTPPALLSAADLRSRVAVATTDGGFARLIVRDHLGAGIVVLSLLLAMFWGAAHAFSPGHGKTIVAAYLVGSRGTARHAALLGLIVTVTHTIGVFTLGLVTLALSQFIVPEQLYPWLNLSSALLVVAVGFGILRWRLRDWRHSRAHAREDAHEHGHSHGHDHVPPQGDGWRGLVGVGVSGGLLPCPTALVVLLAAISLHRVGYGLVLILAFSVGLAGAMTAIGLVAVTARRAFSRVSLKGRLLRLLPAVSALVVLAFGLVMTARALPAVA